MKLQTVKTLDNPFSNTVWVRHTPTYFSQGYDSTYETDKEVFDFQTADNSVDRFSKYEHIAVCNGSPSVNGVHTAKLEVVYKINGYFKKGGKWVDGKKDIATQRFTNHRRLIDECENLLDLEVVYVVEDEIIFEWKSPRNWFTSKKPKLVNQNTKKKRRSFSNINNVRLIPTTEIFELLDDEIWKTSLSQFYGVYQFRNIKTNECYVGSAYGSEGIYGRLNEYKNTGHGNNKVLVEKFNNNPNFLNEYDFTILECFVPNMSKNDVIRSEQMWKKIQGSNLNLN